MPGEGTSGFISLNVTTRSFAAPLFGGRSITSITFNGAQHFANGSDWDVSLFSGFPSSTTLFTANGRSIRVGEGEGWASIGDFPIVSVLGAGPDSYGIEGVLFGMERKRDKFAVFAGRTKYVPLILEGVRNDPKLLGFDYARTLTRGRSISGTLFALRDTATTSGAPARALGRVEYLQEISATSAVFANAWLSTGGATAFRTGVRLRSFRGEATASAFTFGSRLPLLFPMVRPGETGADLAGSYRLTEFSRAYGALAYAARSAIGKGEDVRGHVGWTYTFGTTGPYINAAYYHDELTHELLTGQRQSVLADRFAFTLARYSFFESMALRLDHVMRRNEATRTQLLASYTTLLSNDSTFSSSATIQNEQHAAFGVTADTAYERQLRWPYSGTIGLGAAYIDRSGFASGEGVVRLGISRQLSSQRMGWFARIEGNIRFGIGLPRSDLARDGLTFSIGNRIGWNSMDSARSLFTALVSPSSFGVVEGEVALSGSGVANVKILVDGELRTVTGSSGRFHLTRLPVGVATVSIQSDSLEEGLSVIGDAEQRVLITPDAPARVDFTLARFTSFVGSVVTCSGGEKKGVAGARLALVGQRFVQTTTTSSVGGFEFDSIPPGEYELVIDPSSVTAIPAAQIPRTRVDLTNDVFGRVIEIGCAPALPANPPSGVAAAPQAGEIRGTVRVNGKPLSGAGILLDGQRRSVTAADGSFRLDATAGEHLVSLGIGSERSIKDAANRQVVVVAGVAVAADFDIRRSVRVQGAVFACDGHRRRALAGLTVTLFDALAVRHLVTGAGGRFETADLPPGHYLVLLDGGELRKLGFSPSDVPRLLVHAETDVPAFLIQVGCSGRK